MTEKKGQIIELNAMRGIAAVLVMLGHALNLYTLPSWFEIPTYVFNGRASVVVFFVLSGFVLTHSLAGRALTQPNLTSFYIKRLFRLYPAIWAASALSMVYLVFVHFNIPSPEASDLFLKRFRPERYNTIFIVASFAGMTAYVLPQLWTIFVELVASAFMPFIAFGAYNRRRAFVAWMLVALVLSFLIGNKTYYCVGLYMLEFFVGAAIAVLPFRLVSILASPRFPVGPVAFLATLGLLLSQFLPLEQWSPIAALYECTLAATLISLFVHSRIDVPALRSRFAQYLGNISYSLYLLHFLVACFIVKDLDYLELKNILVLPIIDKTLIVGFFTVLFTLPLAHLCYNYIELPGIELGKCVSRLNFAGLGFMKWIDRLLQHAQGPAVPAAASASEK